MNVIPAPEGHEPREFGAMPAPLPLSGKVTEGTWARVEYEVRRGWFFRDPSCHSGKLF
jgi:hypothetical protein